MQTTQLEATAVVRKNSIGFIEQVFKLYDARRPLVLVSDEDQAKTLSGIQIDHCIVPDERSGWFTGQCLTSAPMGQFRHIAERRVSGSS
jgi:hypothetical protein